jgi:ribonucleoside-triphosphate reductase
VDLVQRITKQAKFHNLIESGAIIHAFVGENRPSAKAIAKLVEMTYRKTNAAQITISPEFTICNRCKKMIPGMSTRCQSCGAENITEAKRKAISPDGTWTKENIEKFMGGKE